MSEALRLADLTRAHGRRVALGSLELSLARGERLAVLGSSGSGKTTLLRLIAGLDAPTRGDVTIAGVHASTVERVLVSPELRGVAMVFQGLALFPHLRALDQIAYAARGPGGRERARGLLERVGLGHRAAASLDELSGGERQRIALARALAQRPALLLMDEPFASLDDARREEMRGLLLELLAGDDDATLVLVTHSRDDTLAIADRVLVLDAGRCVREGPIDEVLRRPHHVAAARALGLGQIVDVVAGDGATTPFGRVAFDALADDGAPLRLLVRPGQARLDAGGAPAEVVGVAWRPPVGADAAPRRLAVVRAGGQTLRVDAPADVKSGDRVGVRVDGACHLLVG